MKITLLDGDVKDFENGLSIHEMAKSLSMRLAKKVMAGMIDGKVVDLRTKVDHDCKVRFLTFDDTEGKKAFWHSASHVMGQAIKRIWPDAQLTIGPAVDNGFYYDVDLKHAITPDDYPIIEAEMRKIVKADYPIEYSVKSREEALAWAEKEHETYKTELIEALPEDETISFYGQGEWADLCAGPHIRSTGQIKAFKIMSLAGAYWHGDENNKMLQRVYGVAFPKKSLLDEHLAKLEEAQKRDHRKLGPQLDLFFLDDTAPGMPYWLPKGWKLFNTLLEFWRDEHEKRGYQEISSPQINYNKLWRQSGHWDHYKDNMFVIPISENEIYGVKPMNCPNAIVVYKRKTRSYRDLPLRLSDCDVLHRKEKSGQLHGLLRVQMFRQDDSHNFITENQIYDEINGILDIADLFYGIFGLEYRPELSTRPADFMGDIALWDKAEAALKEILDKRYGEGGYDINEGDGAFYGPKIDIMMKDALDRTWQMGTIQVDFQLPRNFDLTYMDKDGEFKVPVMIHRVIYGSLERFIGLLIESTAGKFPFWLSPLQVGIVPVREFHNEYAQSIADQLRDHRIRVEVDDRDAQMGGKISKFRKELLPYILIVGDKEKEANTVSVRIRDGVQLHNIPVDAFLKVVDIMNKKRELQLRDSFA